MVLKVCTNPTGTILVISARESQDSSRTSCQAQLLSPVAASSETESAPSSAALQSPGHGAAWLPLPAAQSLSDTRHGHISVYSAYHHITSLGCDIRQYIPAL